MAGVKQKAQKIKSNASQKDTKLRQPDLLTETIKNFAQNRQFYIFLRRIRLYLS